MSERFDQFKKLELDQDGFNAVVVAMSKIAYMNSASTRIYFVRDAFSHVSDTQSVNRLLSTINFSGDTRDVSVRIIFAFQQANFSQSENALEIFLKHLFNKVDDLDDKKKIGGILGVEVEGPHKYGELINFKVGQELTTKSGKIVTFVKWKEEPSVLIEKPALVVTLQSGDETMILLSELKESVGMILIDLQEHMDQEKAVMFIKRISEAL